MLTLHDLGILRDVQITADGAVEVTLTPTYTGCPATAVIAADVETALARSRCRATDGPHRAVPGVDHRLDEPGGQDQTPRLRHRPTRRLPTAVLGSAPIGLTLSARCPRCGSTNTREISRFGSTPCKSLWSCSACAEPFDSFKSI